MKYSLCSITHAWTERERERRMKMYEKLIWKPKKNLQLVQNAKFTILKKITGNILQILWKLMPYLAFTPSSKLCPFALELSQIQVFFLCAIKGKCNNSSPSHSPMFCVAYWYKICYSDTSTQPVQLKAYIHIFRYITVLHISWDSFVTSQHLQQNLNSVTNMPSYKCVKINYATVSCQGAGLKLRHLWITNQLQKKWRRSP